MAAGKEQKQAPERLLTQEQEALLALYLQKLDSYFEELKASDAIQVEIETQHLKKILHT
ncbi:hypothetical protein [Pontibacter kalidii]|uniref:hypothetical protein n=1 Tax=Pontibacter kalidii TaxID=2592049 RepID=UPI00224F0D34|nr:hypothetical protein [Pontibacter kalidii]